jgi:hypothetical protein
MALKQGMNAVRAFGPRLIPPEPLAPHLYFRHPKIRIGFPGGATSAALKTQAAFFAPPPPVTMEEIVMMIDITTMSAVTPAQIRPIYEPGYRRLVA